MNQLFYFLLATSLFTSNTYCSPTNKESTEKIELRINYPKKPEFLVTFHGIRAYDESDIVITLSDCSKWQLQGEEKESAYNDINDNWLPDDDIRIGNCKYKEKDHLAIKNSRTKATYLVHLIIDPSVGTEITSIDKNGYIFVTKNEHYWSAGYWGSFSTCKWLPGDKVIINKGTHSKAEDYELFNTQTNSSVWATKVEWK